MTPQPPKNGQRSTSATEIAFKWNYYLDRGDERAHGDLLRTIDRFIRAEARRMLVHQTYLAEEAAQESLLGVERKIATGEMPDHPAAYVRKVLSNKVATLLQRETRRRAREERYATPEMVEIDLTTGTDWHDFLGTLRQAVTDDEFWTLVLRHHFDFSYDEIGELLEKQPGAVRQIALRGKKKACERMARLEGRVPAWFSLEGSGRSHGWRNGPPPGGHGFGRRPAAGLDRIHQG